LHFIKDEKATGIAFSPSKELQKLKFINCFLVFWVTFATTLLFTTIPLVMQKLATKKRK
jgi:hypothetical protein